MKIVKTSRLGKKPYSAENKGPALKKIELSIREEYCSKVNI